MAVNYAPGPAQNPNAMVMALLAQQQQGGSSGGGSDIEMALRKMMLEKYLGSVGDTSPVQHWTQGLARMANAGVAGYQMNRMLADAKAQEASTANTLGNLPGLGGGGAPATAPQQPSPGPMGGVQGIGNSIAALLAGGGGDQKPAPMPQQPMQQGAEPVVPSQMPMPQERPQQQAALDPGMQAMVQQLMAKPEPQATQPGMAEPPRPPADIPEVPMPPRHPGLQGPMRDYANSIANIESGGRYDLKGPVTKSGDQALGKYQVMGNNLPEWSQAAFGRPVSKQEFLSNPKIQDQLFENRFGGYVDKYGPQGASKAWFAGEGGMKNPNARDQLGTSVASYADRFSRGVPQQGVQMAALGNGVPMPQGGAAPQQQQMAQAQQPQAQQKPRSGLTQEQAAWYQQAIRNPKTRELGLKMLQEWTKPQEYKPHDAGDEIIFHDNQGNVVKREPKKLSTDDLRELAAENAHRREKGMPELSPMDFITAVKRSGAMTNSVVIDQKAESAFSSKAAESQVKRYNDIVEAGFTAKGMRSDLDTLRDLRSRFETGKAAEIKTALGPYAEALGVKMDNLGDMQAYDAIIAKLAPRMRPAGSGATSDFEMQQYLKALPTLGKTPEGNAILDGTMQALQQHQERAAAIASKALNGEIDRKQAEKELRELPDPMTAWKEWKKTQNADGGGWQDMGNGIRIREKN